jgi:hypothetical protein
LIDFFLGKGFEEPVQIPEKLFHVLVKRFGNGRSSRLLISVEPGAEFESRTARSSG